MAKVNLKKIDLTKVKQFLLAKGEKVALGVIAAIGALLVISGIQGAMSVDGKRKVDELRKNTETIRQNISGPGKLEIKEVKVNTAWLPRLSNFIFQQMVLVSEDASIKRTSPPVMPVLVSDDGMQIDYWKTAPIQSYVIAPEAQTAEVIVIKGGGAADKKELAETILPKSLLVVTTFFPLAQQIQQFRSSLHIPRDEDLGKDAPQILGVNVRRVELTSKLNPDTSETMWVPVPGSEVDLYMAGEKNTIVAAKHIRDLLRKVHIDEDALSPFDLHRRPNLMTLMPKLSHASYNPLKLKDFKSAETAGKDKTKSKTPLSGFDKPGQGAKAGRKGDPDIATWDELAPPAGVAPDGGAPGFPRGNNLTDASRVAATVLRFRENYPIFDGQDLIAKADKNAALNLQPGTLPPAKQSDKNAPKKGDTQLDPLIRFFDVDLEPGHTYQYQIAVRLRNPNFGFERKDVQKQEDIEGEELPLNWTETKPFTVPKSPDVLIYAADKWETKAPVHPCGPDNAVLDDRSHRAPVQIHRWFDEIRLGEEKLMIVDWIVAERVLVRRGEYIGRRDLTIMAATWSKLKEDFEIRNPPRLPDEEKEPEKDKNKPAKKKGILDGGDNEKEKEKDVKDKKAPVVVVEPPSGISLDFSGSKFLLVDFEGGPRPIKGATFTTKVNVEDSATDLLILGPDGKLIVRNSHRDYNLPDRGAREREYRERIKMFLPQPDQTGKKGLTGGL